MDKDANDKHEMNIYANILTPPSSSEESPQPFGMPSPQYYYLPTSNDTLHLLLGNQPDQNQSPHLEILEQPVDKFRFRYKSEMAGTHGSLTGINSDKTRKQTYPTVRLRNYKGTAIIRCMLYQIGSSDNRQPHPHRLIKKSGSDEMDDPHHLTVSEQEGYDACFHSMGIIHTAKKHLVEELKRKKMVLKREEIALKEEADRPLNKKEEVEVMTIAEEESKSINLNIVCLRFDAFTRTSTGVLQPICPPVYSHTINNLKSAMTGELKIVRMDHSSSPSNGGREIFMLVEKVTKKNIRIRFYETDDEDNEIWSDVGRFNDLDVHHQYAIVFRTPPYRQIDIDCQKKVFIELLRPTDGSRSEPREFTYFPSRTYKPGCKRARSAGYSSSSGSWTNSFNSGEVPLPVLNINCGSPIPQVNSSELDLAAKNVDSEEFKKLYADIREHLDPYPFYPDVVSVFESMQMDSMAVDALGSQSQSSHHRNVSGYVDLYTITSEDIEIMKRVYNELQAYLKANLSKRKTGGQIVDMLDYLLQKHVNKEFMNNALHLAVIAQEDKLLNYLLQLISLKQNNLLNLVNINKETVMHLVVAQDRMDVAVKILKHKPDLNIQDVNGYTVLHGAIMAGCSESLLATILNCGSTLNIKVNAKNNDNYTALHMAVKCNNLSYVKLLCKYGANVNDPDNKVGGSILHIAVTEQAEDIVGFLLQHPNLNLTIKDFAGRTALQQAFYMNNEKIYKLIDDAMKSKGLFGDCVIKEEEESEEEMETDNLIECKNERLTPEELRGLYENIKTLTPECLDQVAQTLDESGSWGSLADLLDLEHLLHTDLFAKAQSPSKALLNSAVTFGDVLNIRNFLENLEEFKAVEILDKMAISLKQFN